MLLPSQELVQIKELCLCNFGMISALCCLLHFQLCYHRLLSFASCYLIVLNTFWYPYSGLKLISVDSAFAKKHYADLSAQPFFNKLVDYIVSGPVVAMVWEGRNVVATGRKMIGTTNPSDSAPGTIRGDYTIDMGR